MALAPISSLTDAQRQQIALWVQSMPVDAEHMRQVARIALALFDQLHGLHGEPLRYRAVLEVAALTHDVGFSINEKSHHKHSRDLILKRNFSGFSQYETQVIACLARYHRKTEPDLGHALFCDFDATSRQTIHHLGALLRLADGLDRAHNNTLEGLACDITDKEVVLRLSSKRNLVSEMAGVELKKSWFERVYHRTLRAKVGL
ncbi:TPA: hypothetical protein DDW35_08690 [Candidatus Sumerlaeota bacterium]|jgi:exopolyphosphatase / guanosine-5'-triphosphate,3'-diphosphate pyrophosphatase|nr:hypothetical protein [Candidatus Sumerlaeota bacterium]